MCVYRLVSTVVYKCVCVCACTTHPRPNFGLPVQDEQEAVQEVCNEDWLVVESRVKCHKGHWSHTLRRKGRSHLDKLTSMHTQTFQVTTHNTTSSDCMCIYCKQMYTNKKQTH